MPQPDAERDRQWRDPGEAVGERGKPVVDRKVGVPNRPLTGEALGWLGGADRLDRDRPDLQEAEPEPGQGGQRDRVDVQPRAQPDRAREGGAPERLLQAGGRAHLPQRLDQRRPTGERRQRPHRRQRDVAAHRGRQAEEQGAEDRVIGPVRHESYLRP